MSTAGELAYHTLCCFLYQALIFTSLRCQRDVSRCQLSRIVDVYCSGRSVCLSIFLCLCVCLSLRCQRDISRCQLSHIVDVYCSGRSVCLSVSVPVYIYVCVCHFLAFTSRISHFWQTELVTSAQRVISVALNRLQSDTYWQLDNISDKNTI